MSSKETDSFTARPETFIEEAGTTLNSAVDIARKHGGRAETELPLQSPPRCSPGPRTRSTRDGAKRRIASYSNLRKDLSQWKKALAAGSPILAALRLTRAGTTPPRRGKVDTFDSNTIRGGHAICVVGYRTDGRFIVRNSWSACGEGGFAYVKPSYIQAAFFDEAYSVTL